MTTKAITGGFAVCQTRLGAKVHDPKDPGADLGPMFSQVVGTLLRLTERHAERWLDVKGSHDVPIYGFERMGDPPPLEVNVGRLLDEFARGCEVGRRWRGAGPRRATLVERLVADAPSRLDAARRVPTPRWPSRRPRFAFPDDLWARVVDDIAVAARAGGCPIDALVAALVPLYFGRVAEPRHRDRSMTTDAGGEPSSSGRRGVRAGQAVPRRRWREAGAGMSRGGEA